MKTKIFAVALGVIMLGAISPSYAGCDGIYLSGKVGFVNHNMGDSAETTGERLDIDDNSWLLAGAIGYRYGYFRLEAEYTWRQEYSDSSTFMGLTNEFKFESSSYMANLYFDFSPYTMFTPYVMGGIGITHLEFEYSGTTVTTRRYDEDNFTWAVGAGVSAKMTNKWNIDLGYRFLNMGTVQEESIRAHEVYLGTRYVFPID